MPRLVIPKSARNANFANASVQDRPADGYADRLIKYLPAESVAFYALVDKMIASHYGLEPGKAAEAASAGAFTPSLIIFLIGLIGTPLYLRQRRLPGQPWILNVVLSTIAYGFWAYTLGGSLFLVLGWYQVFLAGLFAPIFTFVAGILQPAETGS